MLCLRASTGRRRSQPLGFGARRKLLYRSSRAPRAMWDSPGFKVAMGVCERPPGVRERPPPRPTAYDSRQPKLDFASAPSEGPEHAAATSSSYGSAAAAAAAAGAAAASAAAAAAPLRSFTYAASPLPRTEPNSPRPPLQTLSPSPVASYVPPGILRGGAAETPTHHYAAAAFRGRAAAVRAGLRGSRHHVVRGASTGRAEAGAGGRE